MQQVLFHLPDWLPLIGGKPIYGYGVMLVLGFFGALALAKFLARRVRIDPEVFVNAGLIALASGVIGARLSHVLENWGVYTNPARSAWDNFRAAIDISSGGLTFYGGFIFATFCTIAYGMVKRIPIRLGMDIVAPCVMVGLAFGRIGCLMNGCCYGAECSKADVPWAVRFPYGSAAYVEQVDAGRVAPDPRLFAATEDGRRDGLLPKDRVDRSPELKAVADREHSQWLHPAQVYSTITAFILAAVLVAYFTLPHVPGRGFALMLMLEAPSRFLLELLRAEPAVAGALSFSMVVSLVLFAIGVVLWFVFGRMGHYDAQADDPGGESHDVAAGTPAVA